MFHRARAGVVLPVLALLLVAGAQAQSRTGEIRGTVVDESGGSVTRATVHVSSHALLRSQNTATTPEGDFALGALPPGEYSVAISARGFATWIGEGVRVRVNEVTYLRPVLGLPAASYSLDVNAASGDTVEHFTDSSFVSQSQYSRLPNNRSADSLIWLAAGAIGDGKAGGYQVNGASGAENTFVIDGVEASGLYDGTLGKNAQIPMEWIAETEIRTGAVSSQFGGATGGVINAVTRSGGDEFHGQLSLYLQHDAVNAGPRPLLRLNPLNDAIAEYFPLQRDGFRGLNPGYQLGGFLRKNALWFFSSAYPQFNRVERTVRFTDGVTRSFTADERQDYALNRVDAQVGPRLRLNAAYFYVANRWRGSLPGRFGTSSSAFDYASVGSRSPGAAVTWQADWIAAPTLLLSVFGGYLYGNGKSYGTPHGAYYVYATSSIGVTDSEGLALPLPRELAGPAGSSTPNTQQTLFDKNVRNNVNASRNGCGAAPGCMCSRPATP